MSDNLKVLRVFIASPNDLGDERRAIKEVADSLNGTFGKEASLQIQLLGWEDRLPGFGRPQAQINADVDQADLFVGFLWRRWGSDPGDPKYSSGFEEEFNRALQRREQTGVPEICLFFKAVDQPSLRDPGDQLKKVLDFKEAVVQGKKVLFRDFKDDIADWKQQTRDLLECHLLRLLKTVISLPSKEQPQEPLTSTDTDSAPTAKHSKKSALAGNQQIVRIWSEVAQAIQKGELGEFGKSKTLGRVKVARMGLAVASIVNRDVEAELPGAHLTNLLFKHRTETELTLIEWALVLKTNLACESDNTPGWFWLRRTRINIKTALIILACHDDNAFVRKAAIRFATELDLPLTKRSRKGGCPIEVICSHSELATRKAGLEYLATKGFAKDLPLVERLRSDSDNDVRSQAELTRSAILLREDPTKFFENSVLTCPWMSDDGLAAVPMRVVNVSWD